MEGISPGQPLVVDSGTPQPSPQGVVVADVGWDATRQLPYFTVAPNPPPSFQLPLPPLPATTRIQRKTGIGGLWVIGEDHTFNQQSALTVAKYAYGDGDALCAGFQLHYQGDFLSAGGDEGGLGAAAELRQDLNLFSSTVEDFQPIRSGADHPQGWALTHTEAHLNVERLAVGRPIINMNEHKPTSSQPTRSCSVFSAMTRVSIDAVNNDRQA